MCVFWTAELARSAAGHCIVALRVQRLQETMQTAQAGRIDVRV
jgi:hypothetical protein